ncbi:MAG: hypothetical protein M8467_10740 [Anaerolineae bacterium]|nr:hypothetical protein [Anaerolineae bacterium]
MGGGPKGNRVRRPCWESLFAAVLPPAGLLVALAFLLYGTGTMADADSPSVTVEQSHEMDRGAYLVTEQGTFELFRWHLPLSELPSDAPTHFAEQVHSVLVVSRNPAEATACRLYRLEVSAAVDWRRCERDANQLLLDPGPLPPGGYLLTVPTDDVFGGKTYYYFRLL